MRIRHYYWETHNAEKEDFQYDGTHLDRCTRWLTRALVHPGTQGRDAEVRAEE